MRNVFRTVAALSLACSLLLGSGCAVMQGSPSVTLLSREITADSPNIEVVGEMDKEQDTLTWSLILLMWGKARPTHEAPLARLLKKHNADLLVDAEMKTVWYGVPYIFMQFHMVVTGRPARFVNGGEQ
jgi:hypothetical protein